MKKDWFSLIYSLVLLFSNENENSITDISITENIHPILFCALAPNFIFSAPAIVRSKELGRVGHVLGRVQKCHGGVIKVIFF